MRMMKRAITVLLVLVLAVSALPAATKRADAQIITILPMTVLFDANAEDAHVGTLKGEAKQFVTINAARFGAEVTNKPAYRPMHIFLGWYTSPWGGEKVTADTELTTSHVYAHWENAYEKINSQMDFGKVFVNAFRRGEYSTYNFGTTRLFCDWNGQNSWCTDSALLELMNRALAYDGRLGAVSFFDLRDILMTNCTNNSWVPNMTVSRGTQRVTAAGRSTLGKGVYGNVGYSGGERINYDYSHRFKTLEFTNNYGSRHIDPSTYTVTIDYTPWNNRWKRTNKDYLICMLSKHPEGIWIQVDHRAKEGSHCFVVIGYDEQGFWYLDNGNSNVENGSTGPVRFSGLYDQNFEGRTYAERETDMLNNYLLAMGYVER